MQVRGRWGGGQDEAHGRAPALLQRRHVQPWQAGGCPAGPVTLAPDGQSQQAALQTEPGAQTPVRRWWLTTGHPQGDTPGAGAADLAPACPVPASPRQGPGRAHRGESAATWAGTCLPAAEQLSLLPWVVVMRACVTASSLTSECGLWALGACTPCPTLSPGTKRPAT